MIEKPTILVVDDNKINRIMLHKILSGKFEVLQAENGQIAYDVLHHGEHEVLAVLLDLKMPVMDGYEFLYKIRAISSYDHVPIIAITGGDDENAETRALEAGANDFLEKPFKPDVIRKRLENALHLQRAIFEAKTDALSQLYNRTAFRKYSDDYFRTANREEEKAAIIIIDIDNFKKVNDTSGHAFGDAVIMAYSQELKKACGPNGVVGRLGGDEFIIMLKHIEDVAEVEAVAEDILYRLNHLKISKEYENPTCSMGISLFPKDGKNRSDLYFCADEAMYQAKHLGKNQFGFYGSTSKILKRTSWMNKEWLLDEMSAYIYICDVETHEVYYVNKKSAKLLNGLGEDEPKCFCHQLGLHDQPFTFCKQCPICSDHPFTDIVMSKKTGNKMVVESKLVLWDGRKSRMTIVIEIEE